MKIATITILFLLSHAVLLRLFTLTTLKYIIIRVTLRRIIYTYTHVITFCLTLRSVGFKSIYRFYIN